MRFSPPNLLSFSTCPLLFLSMFFFNRGLSTLSVVSEESILPVITFSFILNLTQLSSFKGSWLFFLKGFAEVIKGELHIIEFLPWLTIIDILGARLGYFTFFSTKPVSYYLDMWTGLNSLACEKKGCLRASVAVILVLRFLSSKRISKSREDCDNFKHSSVSKSMLQALFCVRT